MLPLSKSYAEQEIPLQAETQIKINITEDSDIETLSEEQINSPRKRTNFLRQCYINVPQKTISSDTRPDEQIPVTIDALSLSGTNNMFIYQDDVNLQQGDKYLSADKMTYLLDKELATAEGNVKFINGDLTLYSDSIETYLSNDQITLNQADYQFHGQQGGRGTAKRIHDNGLDLYELNSSSYTACPPEDTTWRLDATTLYIDNAEEVGSAYNAVLRSQRCTCILFPIYHLPVNG